MKHASALLPACLLIATLATESSAQEYLKGSRARLPLQRVGGVMTHTYSPLSGLRATVNSYWFPSGGYLPVEFFFESQQPAAAARDLTLTVDLLTTNRGAAALTVEQEVSFPQGEKARRFKVLVPRVQQKPVALRWTVSVNGVIDREISGQAGLPNSPTDEIPLRIILPDSESAGERAPAVASTPPTSFLGFGQSRSALLPGRRRLRCEFASNWLDYTAADVVALTDAELANAEPAKLTALRRWVLAGGTLWVEDTGLETDRLLAIDARLGIANWRHESVPEEREEAGPEPVAEAKPPPGDPLGIEETTKEVERASEIDPIAGAPGWGFQQADDEDLQAVLKAINPNGGNVKSSSRGWYAVRLVGFGRVLAFAGRAWNAPPRMRFGESEHFRRSWLEGGWSARHGLEPGLASSRFGNLLIPSVGVAPVVAFQVLVTLFVVAIGPLNYWLLWRRGQLPMLVLTVPLGALLSTAGLLVYAGLADGFGVKARARSIALIDQSQGEAVTWSRVSHYVATPPEGSAVFPSDAAIYPIAPAWEGSLANESRSRGTVWDQRGQVLDGGWLPPRSSVQHLVVRSGATDARLTIQQEGDQLRAINQLGVPIEVLFLRDAKGKWWRAAETAATGAITPKKTDRSDAAKEFRTLVLSNRPEFPLGAGKQIEQTLQRLNDRRGVRRLQNRLGTVSLSDNLGEKRVDRLTGLLNGRPLDLPPRSYVAVTRQSVTTPLGWDSVQELGSFHLTVGRW